MKKSVLIAIVISVSALLWILSGQLGDSGPSNPASETQTKPTETPSVQILDSVAQPQEIFLELRGQTQASREVGLKAQTAGRVIEIFIEEGVPVETGDIIARLDMEDRQEKLEQAQANLNDQTILYEAAQELRKEGFQSEQQFQAAESRYYEAKALLRAAALDIEHTQIKAPFDGILNTRMVEVGDFAQVGTELAHVIDLTPIYAVGEISEKNLKDIEIGQSAQVALVNGTSIDGKIHYFSRQAQASTRTYGVEIELENPDNRIPAGMTTRIKIPVRTEMVHHVSPALLTLKDNGEIGLKIVNEQNIIEFMPVEIVDEDDKGIWVTGLPQVARIVSVGQEFVKHGEKVVIKGTS